MRDTKRCPRCRGTKPLQDFYLRGAGRRPGERQGHCKPCMKLDMREYRARRREQRTDTMQRS